MRLNKIILLLIFGLSCQLALADEVNLLGKLDMVSEHVSNKKQRIEAKNTILKLLIECEFDEKCEIQLIGKLEDISKKDPNVIYKGFLTYLKWEKSNLEHFAKQCHIEEKTQVRKEIAACYAITLKKEEEHPPQTRKEIDLYEHQKLLCIKDKLNPLAQSGNIFAQAFMANMAEYLEDTKGMDEWVRKIDAQKGTPKYEQYFRCSEIP